MGVERGYLGAAKGLAIGEAARRRRVAEGSTRKTVQISHGLHQTLRIRRQSTGKTTRRQRGAASLLGKRHPDMKVQLQLAADMPRQPTTDGFAGATQRRLPQQVPEGASVVTMGGARLPEGRLLGQPSCEALEIEHQLGIDGVLASETDHAGLMGQNMANADVVTLIAGKLGPVLRQFRIEIQQSLLHHLQHAECGEALAHREQVDQRVPLPRKSLALIRQAAPEIDHHPTIHHHGHCGAQLRAIGQRPVEARAHGFEPGSALARR